MPIDLPHDLPTRLSARLLQPLPGTAAQFTMVPPGRHSGDPTTYRSAAVLLAVHKREGRWTVPLILRADDGYAHGGQIGLPGGRLEDGETLAQCALRETEEEVGLTVGESQLLGPLTPLPVPVSKHVIYPFVAVSGDDPVFIPDHNEVADVIPLDLTMLLAPDLRRVDVIELPAAPSRPPRHLKDVPQFTVAGHRVWGATAMILAEFQAVLKTL